MFRLRQTDDLDLIRDLNRAIFPITGAIDEEDLDESTWWVAERRRFAAGVPRHLDYDAVGFGGVRMMVDHAFMTRAGVLKEHRGHGLQQRLIQARVRWAKAHGAPSIRTYVWSGNIASMRSLCKQGFLPYKRTREPASGENLYPFTFIHLERHLAETGAQHRPRHAA